MSPCTTVRVLLEIRVRDVIGPRCSYPRSLDPLKHITPPPGPKQGTIRPRATPQSESPDTLRNTVVLLKPSILPEVHIMSPIPLILRPSLLITPWSKVALPGPRLAPYTAPTRPTAASSRRYLSAPSQAGKRKAKVKRTRK